MLNKEMLIEMAFTEYEEEEEGEERVIKEL